MADQGRDNYAFTENEKPEDIGLVITTLASNPDDGELRHRATGTVLTGFDETVELGPPPSGEDPLGLKHRRKSKAELDQLPKTKTKKKLAKFYESQNEIIDELLAPLQPEEETAAHAASGALKIKIAIYGSLAANILLFLLQLLAAIISNSLALFATMADAFMDLTSSLILVGANYLAKKPEIYGYPSGKARFETVGIIIFGTLMSTLSLMLIFKAVMALISLLTLTISGIVPETTDLDVMSICLVAAALAMKLVLFLYCRLLDHPTAQILAQDHRNDLFANSTGIILAILGSTVSPYFDPAGAIVIALVILRSWTGAVAKNSRLIVGKCADPNFLKKVTYIAMTHDDKILQVDTCRAYHAGEKIVVEVDIVLPPETTLQESHDLAESLQVKLESLGNVERAFVHSDYETTHKPEHRKFS